MKKYYICSLLLIVLFAVSPFMVMMLASAVANWAGCTLNEADVHTCMIHGHDYGETLYTMAVGMWLMIFTVAMAQVAFLVWAIVLALHLAVRRRRRAAPQV